MAHRNLGDLLVENGLLTSEQLQLALQLQGQSQRRLDAILLELGFVTDSQLLQALQVQLGIDFIDLSAIVISAEMAQVLSQSIAQRHTVVPVRVVKDTLYLAMGEPTNFLALEEVRRATGKKVMPLIATTQAVERAIAALYGNESAARAIDEMKREVGFAPEGIGDEVLDEPTSPTAKLVESIIERAVSERASDIHIEPHEGELLVRMRIDGVLQTILSVPKQLDLSVLSRLKIMGRMDIAEKRVPQDGRTTVKVRGQSFDLRLSTLPTLHGEKIVIRLLQKDSALLHEDAIGLQGQALEDYHTLIQSKSGVILVVGPTGSGKTSTMYTMIRKLNTDQVNLITLEDPVEYNFNGMNQVQIDTRTGMTFASGLRAILRQDPDVIAVGEIRDGETAQIALRAAITGHLVLSTLHTNSALAVIDRLLDIGCPPYMIAAALRGVISQRLVRKVCPQCRQEYAPTQQELALLGLEGLGYTFSRGKGCPACFGTGFRGRTGVFEVVVFDSALKGEISKGLSQAGLREVLARRNAPTFSDYCRKLVLDGVTTVQEALRTINSVEL